MYRLPKEFLWENVLKTYLDRKLTSGFVSLLQYTQIRKDFVGKPAQQKGGNNNTTNKNNKNPKEVSESVAPIFMRYQRGCQQVGRTRHEF